MKRQLKNKIYFFFIIFILSGCGFSSGLYKDILDAQDYIAKQDFKSAVNLYENILYKKPSKAIKIKILYQLGEVYSLYLFDYKKSVKRFLELLEETDDPLWVVKATEKIAMISFNNTRDYEMALSSFNKLINFRPELEKIDEYKELYAESLIQLKRNDDAKKILIELTTKSNSISAYYQLGLIEFYKLNTDEAVKYWFEYLKREKRKDRIVQAKFMIANAYESAERLKEAYNIYYSILGDYPNQDVIKKRLESIYQRRIARKR